MTAKEIINAIIEKNNSNPTKGKIELKKEVKDDYVSIEFGEFPNATSIVKQSDSSQSEEVLEERCYGSILDFMIRPLISVNYTEVAENRN